MRPDVVLGMILFYVFSKGPLQQFRDWLGVNLNKTPTFRAFVAAHNAALVVFSAICAWNSWAVVFEHWFQNGVRAIHCDADGSLWTNGVGAWSTIFYLSKYYEFMDTWILVLKDKKVSFLQVYHHIGVAFVMWLGVATQSSWLVVIVLLNSVIHTFMYTYFFIKTVAPTVEIKAAKYLTFAQIGQFMIGIITSSAGVFTMGTECSSTGSLFGLACSHLYGYGLLALFAAFASKKYKTVRQKTL